jgi:hypothetical protein
VLAFADQPLDDALSGIALSRAGVADDGYVVLKRALGWGLLLGRLVTVDLGEGLPADLRERLTTLAGAVASSPKNAPAIFCTAGDRTAPAYP